MSKIDLKALPLRELDSLSLKIGLPAFRLRQLRHWIYEKYAISIQDITEFSKDLREKLSEQFYISNLKLKDRQFSKDGTEKFLFGLEDEETVESVLITDKDRLTLCISSQVGCTMGCRFCLTGKLGLKRHLAAHEITDQIVAVNRLIPPLRLTNIVLMGMGEPLSNSDNVIEALWRITVLMSVSPRRITLSTSGIVPKLLELSRKAPLVNLAVSLNATTDKVRNEIMPVNKTYPIRKLLEACRKYPLPPGRKITFEYVLIKGINDTPEDARRLVILLKGISAKVNLIPLNPYEGSDFEKPKDEDISNFQKILESRNIVALVRKSKGQDILAACGQLRASYPPSDSISHQHN